MTDKIMMDGEPMEIGNEVYSLNSGKGEVSYIHLDGLYPIGVGFENGTIESFTSDFKFMKSDKNRDLYWQKPEIVPPPKPKKKVKVWDWFIEYKDGSICRMTGQLADFQNFFHINLAQKIDGTERELER